MSTKLKPAAKRTRSRRPSPAICSAFRWKPMDVAYSDNLHCPVVLVLEVNPKYPQFCYTTCSLNDGIGSHSDHSLRTRDEWLKWLERFSDDLTGREMRESRERVLAPIVEPPSWAGFRKRYAETGDPWIREEQSPKSGLGAAGAQMQGRDRDMASQQTLTPNGAGERRPK